MECIVLVNLPRYLVKYVPLCTWYIDRKIEENKLFIVVLVMVGTRLSLLLMPSILPKTKIHVVDLLINLNWSLDVSYW